MTTASQQGVVELRASLSAIAEHFSAGAAGPDESPQLRAFQTVVQRYILSPTPETRTAALADLAATLQQLSHAGFLRGALFLIAERLVTYLRPDRANAAEIAAQHQLSDCLPLLLLLTRELCDALAPELGNELAEQLLAQPEVETQRFAANSTYVDLHRILAEHHADLGDWIASLRHFEAILACDIDDAAALTGFARCLEHNPEARSQITSGSELLEGLADLNSDDLSEHPRYELGRPLGRGRHAVVYTAIDRRVGRRVAVKRLLDRRGAQANRGQLSSADARQFFAEARSLAAIRSPHVVSILDVQPDHRFIVLDLCEGGSLRAALRRRTYKRERFADAAEQLRHGLSAIHAAGAVHRDVKPANLLLRSRKPNARLALADFGLALAADRTTGGAAARRAGTLRYLSPEQRRGEPASPASDLYSAGLVLLELAHAPGALPRELAAQLDSLAGLGEAAAWIPEGLPASQSAMIQQLLHQDPAERRFEP